MRKFKTILFLFLCLGTALLLVNSFTLSLNHTIHKFSETLESQWKASRFHHDIQHISNRTQNALPKNNKTYLYVHVPRTGGDSLATHLFSLPKDQKFNDPTRKSWWGRYGVPDLYTSLKQDDHFKGPMNYKRMYKAFFSRDRIVKTINHATQANTNDGSSFDTRFKTIQKFTILRHPHERLYSIYKHFNKYSDIVCSGSFHDFLQQILSPVLSPASYVCNATSINRESTYTFHNKHQTFGINSLIYQLGHVMQYDLRTLPPKEAYERAIQFLDSMDFIGFYEDWNIDYHRLAATIFTEWEGTLTWYQWFRQEMFFFATWIVRNRMKTFKYTGHIQGEDRLLMEECTKWDMKLYQYARRKLGRDDSATGGLYTHYKSWVAQEVAPLVVVLLLLYGMLRCSRRKVSGGAGGGGGGGESETVDGMV